MNEVEKEEYKIKLDAKKLKGYHIKKDIKNNYEIGIEYFKDINKHKK